MKCLMKMMMKLVNVRLPDANERFLARSVDSSDFEIRVQTLERSRG
jgi:hypothetical protein